MGENKIVKQLQAVAGKLTGDRQLQRKLLPAMLTHLVETRTRNPSRPMEWCLKSCEIYASNCLKSKPSYQPPVASERSTGSVDSLGWLAGSEVIDRLTPHLSDAQQRTLFLLMKGYGVRDVARDLGLTEVAVLRHRQRIERVARQLIEGSVGFGMSSGAGSEHTTLTMN